MVPSKAGRPATPTERHLRWHALGSVPPGDLTSARLELHAAIQCVASVATTYLPRAADDSHVSTEWVAAGGALAGNVVPVARPFRAGLRLAAPALLLADADDWRPVEFPLRGRTLEQAYAWLAEVVAERTGAAPDALERVGSPLPPEQPVVRGERLQCDPAEPYAELARWYANADHALSRVAGEWEGASAVRCWPHHFDIATLITVARSPSGQATQTVGAGLAPGDKSYGDPYWYVTPWPYPPTDRALPPLPAGAHWHREGWVGAVFTARDTIAVRDPEAQAARVREFLRVAVRASRALLG